MYRCLLCGVENQSRRFFTLKNNNMLVKKMIPLLERASDINIAHRSDRICSQLASSCLKRLSMLNDLILYKNVVGYTTHYFCKYGFCFWVITKSSLQFCMGTFAVDLSAFTLSCKVSDWPKLPVYGRTKI